MIVLAALSMVALFAFAALSIDLARFHQQQRELQSATDASALAATLLLTNSPPDSGLISQEATITAQANGLGSNEVGTVEAGQWDTNALTFAAGGPPYNAVRVPARRTVPLMFGPVIGMAAMTPVVHSVAMLQGAGSAFGGSGSGCPLMPFAVLQRAATNAFYSQYTITKDDVSTTGNFGPLDLGGTQQNTDADWQYNMTVGCNCTVSIGDQVNTSTGVDKIYDGFCARLNAPYSEFCGVIAIVEQWPTGGSSNVGIVGFVGVQIISAVADNNGNGNGGGGNNCNGGGGNFTITLENMPVVLGGSGGGTTNEPYALARVLVQ
jgi:hypothetical protein